MIVTEKATERLDLPHAVERAKDTSPCACGRPDHDPIHNVNVLERASHPAPAVVTEKGI